MEGYILEHRKIIQWRWYHDIAVAHLFRHLILCANYITADWQDITIYRGQLVTSRQRLSDETGLTEKVVRRCLKVLARTGEISIKTTSQYSLITICNYSKYQGDIHNADQQMANKRPTEGQQKAINKKEKESKNNKSSLREDSTSSCSSTASENAIDYQAFKKFFNETVEGKGIRQIVQITTNRQCLIDACVKEFGKDAIATVVRKAAASSWLNGGGGKFIAKFDWLFQPTNFVKVLEGNYDDRPAFTQTSIEVSLTPSIQSTFKYSSYEDHRIIEQQKRFDTYAEAVEETLNRS